ncbi:MAG: copper homeostasis protein CutC [Clostridiaceae bacterium]|nr:copper homeostasis protein CutC [Clostridiaceae bacterium]
MIEIIASSLSDAIAIEQAGADRIELVSALSEGGFTPSIGLVKKIIEQVKIPTAVMLRPNRSEFVYTAEEIEVLREDALLFEQFGVKIVVMGILAENRLPDIDIMERILNGTNLELTFHRAIDESADILQSVEILNNYQRVTRILTSGGPGKATQNLEQLKSILALSNKKIIVGSGVDMLNVNLIQQELQGYNYDLHVGGAVRGGDVRADVSIAEVEQFVNLVKK